jgi:hypothetical protein
MHCASRNLTVTAAKPQRHCERSEAIHCFFLRHDGLLRGARNDGLLTPEPLRD